MITLTKKVIKILKKQKTGIKLETLIRTLKLRKEEIEILKLLLEKLEQEGQIYLNENNKYIPFPKDDNLTISQIHLSPKKNPYIFIDQKVVFIPSENLENIMDGDTVLVRKNVFTQIKDKEISVEKIFKKQKHIIIFECIGSREQKKIRPYALPFQFSISLDHKDWNSLSVGDIFSVYINTINGSLHSEMITKIGNRHTPYLPLKIIAAAHGIRICFPNEVEKEAQQIPTFISQSEIKTEIENGRKDFRNETIFTIDGKYAEDLDDAISLQINEKGNYVLGIYTSDVSYYVKEGSAIQQEALKRGTSYYFYNCIIPMLPESLSTGICSLSPNEERFARAIIIEITPTGKVINYQKLKCIICSKKKMSYEDLNSIFDNHIDVEGYEEFIPTLKKMYKLSRELEKKKIERGYIYFEKNKFRLVIDEDGTPKSVIATKRGSSERVIENFMLLANELEADYQQKIQSFNEKLPFIYRTQDVPNPLKIEEAIDYLINSGFSIRKNSYQNPKNFQILLRVFANTPSFPAIASILTNDLSKAQDSIQNIGHYGLGLHAYTRVTSPIRRYSDLQTQYNMDTFTQHSLPLDIDKKREEMINICNHTTQSDKLGKKAKKDIAAYQLTLYMKNLIGKNFKVIIVSLNKYQVSVKTNTCIIGTIPIKNFLQQGYELQNKETTLINKLSGNSLRIGDFIQVTLTEANLETNHICFSLPISNEKIEENQKIKLYTK